MPAPRKSTRREFLVGRAAADALTDLADHTLPAEATGAGRAAPAASFLLQIARQAMGCEFEVLLNAGQYGGAAEAALAALDLVQELESQLTVFRDDSQVMQLNRQAADGPVPVEPRLFALLEHAVQLHQRTHGAFDITANPLWKTWGFHRREGRFPSADAIRQARQTVGSQWLDLDAHQSSVRFARPGMEINLGAIGKGYALDRAARQLHEAGIHDFLVHGGQSSMLARGRRRGAARPGWTVALRHPRYPDRRLAEIHLRDRALGTSGSGNQFFHFQGRRYGHVLDPRSGYPAESLLSATVLAASAAEADALATACFVLGVESSFQLCDQHPQLAALLVAPGPRDGEIVLHTIGLEDDEWSLYEAETPNVSERSSGS